MELQNHNQDMPTGSQPDSMGKTTIQLDDETADRLYERKARGESYDDVVRRLLGETNGNGADSPGVDMKPATERSDDGIVVPEDVPNHIDHADARAAIQAAVELVSSGGGVQRSEIAKTIGETHSLGYDNFGRKGSWWRKVIKPGLEANGCKYTNGVGWSE